MPDIAKNFLANISGNKYTHSGNLFKSEIGEEGSMLSGLMQLSAFAGIIGGDFPFHNDLLYRADVHDIKVQASVNFTLEFQIEILKIF